MKKHKCINYGTLTVCGNKEDMRKAINNHKKDLSKFWKIFGELIDRAR